ncbi:ATP-binding cassette domain-containing protein [Alphaproteobacteria bacterium]|nr:ATP-binding cassette domain-containing protein [Alphaproteobacteria bacterium]MBT5798451.1 ATP-binding cassette domain-containing protein [Alphaproteobacteria bacterium]MDA9189906.1 ATP-binding cassette domain-containing protein [Alphaproteobacteria bacterium]MDA9815996.1 ATP-binding cassette domain-containing protein [Alphaproteobacteria bacterium]MDC0461454.1 ATP-binding cassette domain-containing protein [Alphaproteobacteria bacterium]
MSNKKTEPNKIDISNLYKQFGQNVVLNNFNLAIKNGESLCLIGTSGCGKSVALKCLIGLIHADSGSIKVDGQETLGQSRSEHENLLNRFGMTFQFGALFDSLPIWENVTFRLRQKEKLNRKIAREIAGDIIDQLGLAPRVLDLYPAELSGGMQKRAAIARAIADKPEILLFDEPTSGLDPITSGVINDLILNSVKRLGATTLTISHDMASVRQIADKVAMIHHGSIIWCGPVADMHQTGIPEVDQFVNGRPYGPLTSTAPKIEKTAPSEIIN